MHGWLVRLKKPTTEYSKTTGGPSERMSDEQKRAFLAKALSCDIPNDEDEEVDESDGEGRASNQKQAKEAQMMVAEADDGPRGDPKELNTGLEPLTLVPPRRKKGGAKRKAKESRELAKRARHV